MAAEMASNSSGMAVRITIMFGLYLT
jgi:hypothetical protein